MAKCEKCRNYTEENAIAELRITADSGVLKFAADCPKCFDGTLQWSWSAMRSWAPPYKNLVRQFSNYEVDLTADWSLRKV